MGILAAREISRFKGIGLCERHRWYRFPNIGFSLPPRSFLFLLRSVPHRGNDLAFISPSGSGYFVTAGPSRCLSLLLPSFPRPSSRHVATSARYSTSFSTNVTRNAISYHRHHRHIPDNYSLSSISISHILP